MEPRIASSCPSMTLRDREVLDAMQLGFLIPPLPTIFQASATQVLTKALLQAFINRLLSMIHDENSLMDIPTTNCWGLKGNEDGFVNLDGWDLRQASQDVYTVVALPVMSDPGKLAPIRPQWATLGGGGAGWPSLIKSISLPSQGAFEIRGSHLLLVIHCRVRVRISNRRTKVDETTHSVLVPADLKVVDLLKAFKVRGDVSGVFEMPDSSRNIQTSDIRTVTDLGWRHGTELRVEVL